jgi:hypothetical protein
MNRVDSVGGDFPAPLSLGVMTGSNQTNIAHTGDIESFTPSIVRMTERSNLLQMTPCKRINDAPRVEEPGVNLPGTPEGVNVHSRVHNGEIKEHSKMSIQLRRDFKRNRAVFTALFRNCFLNCKHIVAKSVPNIHSYYRLPYARR